MDGMVAPVTRKPTINEIQRAICMVYGVTLAELLGENHETRIAHPRQLACYLTRTMTGYSYPHIAHHFGGRHHTTIMFACRQVEARIAKNPDLVECIAELKARVMDAVGSRPAVERVMQPKKTKPGEIWSEAEIATLKHLWAQRFTAKEIGAVLCRHSQRAIYSKAHKLCLPPREGDALTAPVIQLRAEEAA